MKKITFIFLLAIIANIKFVNAQEKQEWKTIFGNINKEVLDHSMAYETLKEATSTIGHRLTGSANGKKAETYTYNLLKSYGFANLRYQPFEVESWSRGNLSVTIGTDTNHLVAVKSVALAHSPVKSDISNEVVDMGNGLEEDYLAAPEKAKGKIVLVYLGVLPGSKEGTKSLVRPMLHRDGLIRQCHHII